MVQADFEALWRSPDATVNLIAVRASFQYVKQVDMSNLAATYGVLTKDFRSEVRTRYAFNALLMFVVTAVTIILFALQEENPNPEVLSGMFWVVVFFSGMSGLSRTFVSEEERGTTLTLQLLTRSSVVYFGKLIFNILLSIILSVSITMLYVVAFPGFIVQSVSVFVISLLLGSVGLAAATTIIAAIIAKANTKGTLYPVLSFPILLPLLMTVMKATSIALAGGGIGEALEQFQIMVSYILVMVAGSYLLFDFVWND
ncbi:MAG TPA: heme exporter protein CcmB [Bacteroidota bacterium]|nr:heme exporter protein CcmB [Bacteroidota bacterium]